MTSAAQLSTAIEVRLGSIGPGTGFHTDIRAVYGFGKPKPDAAPFPCLLVRIASDVREGGVGSKILRAVTYQIEGVMARTASLQDLQRLHHDLIKAIGADPLPMVRALANGWLFEESAEFDPDNDGSTYRTVVSSITLRYIETY